MFDSGAGPAGFPLRGPAEGAHAAPWVPSVDTGRASKALRRNPRPDSALVLMLSLAKVAPVGAVGCIFVSFSHCCSSRVPLAPFAVPVVWVLARLERSAGVLEAGRQGGRAGVWGASRRRMRMHMDLQARELWDLALPPIISTVSLWGRLRAQSRFWYELAQAWEGCPQAAASPQLPGRGAPEHAVLWSLFPSACTRRWRQSLPLVGAPAWEGFLLQLLVLEVVRKGRCRCPWDLFGGLRRTFASDNGLRSPCW